MSEPPPSDTRMSDGAGRGGSEVTSPRPAVGATLLAHAKQVTDSVP